MDRVLARLWIGETKDFRAPLRALGFAGVLDLRDGKFVAADGVATHKIGNRDGDAWTREQVLAGLDFISERILVGNVLVACAAGMSRSASMVIGYLVRCGWDVVDAHEKVWCARPRIAPVPNMLDSVLTAVRSAEKKETT
jgi:protein-tyrosine phosphatase